jgi:hypothetical protein
MHSPPFFCLFRALRACQLIEVPASQAKIEDRRRLCPVEPALAKGMIPKPKALLGQRLGDEPLSSTVAVMAP